MKHSTDPLRLIEEASTSRLLRSALEDADGEQGLPTPGQLDALASRLAPLLGGPTGGGPSDAPPAPPAPPPAAAPAVATTGPAGSLLAPAVIAIAVVGAGAALWWSAGPSGPPPSSSATAAAPSPATAPIATATESAPVAEPSPRAEPELAASGAAQPSRSSPAAAPLRGSAATSASVAPADDTEASLLGKAQDALASDPARALAITADHQRRYPSGSLGQEREVITIGALVRLGRVAEARERAARFSERFPDSPHRRRIEALLP